MTPTPRKSRRAARKTVNLGREILMADYDKGPILVTGASGGIGGATVRHLVR